MSAEPHTVTHDKPLVCPVCGSKLYPSEPCKCDDPDAPAMWYCAECGHTEKIKGPRT